MENPRMLMGRELSELIAQMKLYQKIKPILAIQIHEDISLGEGFGGDITGSLTVCAGSWIAHDPENNRTWPISEHIFRKVYAEVDPE